MNDPNLFAAGRFGTVLNLDNFSLTETILRAGFISSLPARAGSFPIYRKIHFSAFGELATCFDDFALSLGWTALRLDERTLMLHSEGLLIEAEGDQKLTYCFCSIQVWADSVARAESALASILAATEKHRITKPMFSLSWNYLCPNEGVKQVTLQEIADDVLHDSAYPDLGEGVGQFITNYLDAQETVLVIQGNPGNGKTRLIRAILAELSRRKGAPTKALYTTDCKVLESDEIFRRFVNGLHEAFVLEDADYLLRPRAHGNDNLHRFLGIADGVIRSKGRKIIFSTNLPNVGDIDDALIRPGRCFARIRVRELSAPEAETLLVELCEADSEKATAIMGRLAMLKTKVYSLANIYRAFGDSTRLAARQPLPQ